MVLVFGIDYALFNVQPFALFCSLLGLIPMASYFSARTPFFCLKTWLIRLNKGDFECWQMICLLIK